jgi:hypothetical protein
MPQKKDVSQEKIIQYATMDAILNQMEKEKEESSIVHLHSSIKSNTTDLTDPAAPSESPTALND